MPRRKPRRDKQTPGGEKRPLGDVFGRTESGPDSDETYIVRTVSGARAVKSYRCPGCDHEIPPGTPHIVAWQADSEDDRRHWHTGCWRGRRTRTITRRWS